MTSVFEAVLLIEYNMQYLSCNSASYSTQFWRNTLCRPRPIVFETFAMVDDAKFKLLHRSYIGNFDQTSDWSEYNKHLGKNFEREQNILYRGGIG